MGDDEGKKEPDSGAPVRQALEGVGKADDEGAQSPQVA